MNKQLKIVAFVPIKKDSERIPGKSFNLLGEKPLYEYLLSTLLKVPELSSVYVYSSFEELESQLPEGIQFFNRDKSLDDSETKGMEIYRSFVEKVDADLYVLAHVTSPFILATRIQKSIWAVMSGSYDSALSVQSHKTFAWFQNKPLNYDLKDVPRTQNLDSIKVETSGFYIFSKELIMKHSRRVGFKPFFSEIDDVEAIDIDRWHDFEMAENLLPIYFDKLRNDLPGQKK